MSSSEIIRCKECGQVFDTIESLKEHEESEKEDKELQNKGLWLPELERDPVNVNSRLLVAAKEMSRSYSWS